MNSLLAPIFATLVPLLLLLVPGSIFLPWHREERFSGKGVRVILWSVVSVSLATLIAAWIGVSSTVVIVVGLLVTAVSWWWQRRRWEQHRSHFAAIVFTAIFVVVFSVASLPFLVYHQGLPSGDVQKALIWADEINQTNKLPQYRNSIVMLNRDPVDFFTPALHTYTALLLRLSPLPLLSVGFMAVAVSVATALTGASLARLLFPKMPAVLLLGTTALLILSHGRFLRFVREPGYHFQNAVGELLLFGLFFLLLSLLKHWRWPDIVLLTLTVVTLALSHQFSAFVGAFMLLPAIVMLAISPLRRLSRSARFGIIVPLVGIGVIAAVASMFDLHHKIGHLFNGDPHLLFLTPTWLDYPRLLGTVWLFLGVAGVAVLVATQLRRKNRSASVIALIGAVVMIVILSQGPRLAIDIPPVRALLYLVVPLSVCAAYLLLQSAAALRRLPLTPPTRTYLLIGLVIGVIACSITAAKAAFTLSHTVRTNSTLTPGQEVLAHYLSQEPGTPAVLIDDYNRRSSSWLVLSGKPMYTRLASDLSLQMREAHQSALRYQLYLAQLDYEKIFSLGSYPTVAVLLDKHNIGWVTGISGTSDTGFAANPALTPFAHGDDITLYTPRSAIPAACEVTAPSDYTSWLLSASTLVNDIGDMEDTFEHLPASLRAVSLSPPQIAGACTSRQTTASVIPLRFNVDDYVSVLWDQEHSNRPDVSLELLLVLAEHPADLVVQTSTGFQLPVAGPDALPLPAAAVPIEPDGFITLSLLNPQRAAVTFDLIALGPSRVP